MIKQKTNKFCFEMFIPDMLLIETIQNSNSNEMSTCFLLNKIKYTFNNTN